MVSYLIENGCDCNVKFELNQNPIIHAILNKQYEIACLLVSFLGILYHTIYFKYLGSPSSQASHGSNIYATDQFGQNAFHLVLDDIILQKLKDSYDEFGHC